MATPADGDDVSPSPFNSSPEPSDSDPGLGSPPPSLTPSVSPPPAPMENSSALSPPAPAARGSPPVAPSRDSPPSQPASKHSGGDSNKSGGRSKSGSSSNEATQVGVIVVGVVIGALAFGLLMCIAACVCCLKKKKRKKPPHMNMPYYTDEHGTRCADRRHANGRRQCGVTTLTGRAYVQGTSSTRTACPSGRTARWTTAGTRPTRRRAGT